jgi:hypothetical protein
MYTSSAQYTKFAQDTFATEKALVEKLGLAKGNRRGSGQLGGALQTRCVIPAKAGIQGLLDLCQKVTGSRPSPGRQTSSRRDDSALLRAVPMYMSFAQYTKFARDTFATEKALVQKLGLAKGN